RSTRTWTGIICARFTNSFTRDPELYVAPGPRRKDEERVVRPNHRRRSLAVAHDVGPGSRARVGDFVRSGDRAPEQRGVPAPAGADVAAGARHAPAPAS